MKRILLRHGARIATAILLLAALWALKTLAFVSLPGIGPEKYDSFGKIPDRCLSVSLTLAIVLTLFGLRKLTILFAGISLGLFSANVVSIIQQIVEMQAMAEDGGDTEAKDMIVQTLAGSNAEPGIWILSVSLVLAAVFAVLPPIGRPSEP